MLLVQNVSKLYRLYGRPADRLLESLPLVGRRKRHTDFWALRDVSFSMEAGEILGVMGPNGSGKSTLLQVVTGITRPTSGRVAVEGRIAALLELGAGFNPEFTGRENVFLNSEIMGLSRKETERAFPKVEAFAGIGQYIDRPVKEYSSGMYVRLAFAAAIHVEPEILVVDEALAVGDAIFAGRCLKKLEELKRAGVTILFVSHDLGLIKRLCTRAILMVNGQVAASGSPSEVVNRYVALVHERDETTEPVSALTGGARHGDGASRIRKIEILDASGNDTRLPRAREPVRVRVEAEFQRAVRHPIVGMLIRNRLGIDVFGTNTRIEGIDLGEWQPGERMQIEFAFDCLLRRGEYTLTLATQHDDGSSQDWLDDALTFSVVDDRDAAGLAGLKTSIAWTRAAQLS